MLSFSFRLVYDFVDYFAIVITAYYVWSICTIYSTLLVVQMELVMQIRVNHLYHFEFKRITLSLSKLGTQNWPRSRNGEASDFDVLVVCANIHVLQFRRKCCRWLWRTQRCNLRCSLVFISNSYSTHVPNGYDGHSKAHDTIWIREYSKHARSF